jgi:BolA protein
MSASDPSYAKRIESKLQAAFDPLSLEIRDDSHRHVGHAGASPLGETHFAVSMVSAAFTGQSRVARQRAVYAALREELESHVHALQLQLKAPEEG